MSLAKDVYVHILRARETKWDLCLSEQSDTTTSKAAPFLFMEHNVATEINKSHKYKLEKAPRLTISHKVNLFSSKGIMKK